MNGTRASLPAWLLLSTLLVLALFAVASAPAASAQGAPAAPAPAQHAGGGEADLRVPDLSTVRFGGVSGTTLLTWGLVVVVLWWNDNPIFGGQPETVIPAIFVGAIGGLSLRSRLAGPHDDLLAGVVRDKARQQRQESPHAQQWAP